MPTPGFAGTRPRAARANTRADVSGPTARSCTHVLWRRDASRPPAGPPGHMPGHTLPCHPPRTRAGGARSRAASRGPRLSERARLAERQTLGRETESQRHGVARCGAHLVGVRAHHVCRGRAGLGVGIQALEHLGRRRCGRNCTTGYRNEHTPRTAKMTAVEQGIS